MKKAITFCLLGLIVGAVGGYLVASHQKQKTIRTLQNLRLQDQMDNMLILADTCRQGEVDEVLEAVERHIAVELMLNREYPGGYRQEYFNATRMIPRIEEFVRKYPDSELKQALAGRLGDWDASSGDSI